MKRRKIKPYILHYSPAKSMMPYGIAFSSYYVKPATKKEVFRQLIWGILRNTIGRIKT